MNKMRAVRVLAPGMVEICTMEMPRPKAGEALLRPLYGGICGSDLNAYLGKMAYFSYPRIPGHEFSAVIERIGDNSQGFQAGDVVTCNPYFNCGGCYACQKGLVNACMSNQTMGVQREGSFMEYITMPVERLIRGGGLSPKTLALIEPFCIGHNSVQRTRVRKADTVLVIGAGTIGLLAALAAKACGAKVCLADIAPYKLEQATRFGLMDHILNTSKDAFDAEVNEVTDGNGFDVTIEAVGLPSTFQNCLDASSFGGRVAVVGVGKQKLDFDFTIIQKKELSIFGSRNALTQDFVTLVETLQKQPLDLESIVTRIYPFEQAAQAFSDLKQNASRMLKVLIEFD